MTEIALKQVPTFKYALGGIALLLLAATLLNYVPDPALGFLIAAGCLLFGVLFFALERIAADPEIKDLIRQVIALVFWAVSVAFVVLLCFLLIWVGSSVWRQLFPTRLTAQEQQAEAYEDEVNEMSDKWEAAIHGSPETGLEHVVTRSEQLAGDLEYLNSARLSYAYDLMRHRYAAIASLMACSLADRTGHADVAVQYCAEGLKASQKAFDVAADIRRLRDSKTAAHFKWLQESDQESRLLRTKAQLSAMLFGLTHQISYRDTACEALSGMSLSYRQEDPAVTSLILTRNLPLGAGDGQCSTAPTGAAAKAELSQQPSDTVESTALAAPSE